MQFRKPLLAVAVIVIASLAGVGQGEAAYQLGAPEKVLQGTITVSAASSLSESFVEIAKEFRKEIQRQKFGSTLARHHRWSRKFKQAHRAMWLLLQISQTLKSSSNLVKLRALVIRKSLHVTKWQLRLSLVIR